MSDPSIDALAESARNRGLKLVRSRIQTPGKRRFGKVGLTDKGGKPIFGMDAKGPTATPDAVEEYLRQAVSGDWGASIDADPVARTRRPAKRGPKAANDGEGEATQRRSRPELAVKAKPKPKPEVREARPKDSSALVALIGLLGAKVDEKGVRKRLSALVREGNPPLVATLGKDVVGLCGTHRMVALHRERPVGRINVLVVREDARGQAIGRMLVEAAEERFTREGCELVEITSNDRLTAAHAFYRHLGYERTSIRFAKKL